MWWDTSSPGHCELLRPPRSRRCVWSTPLSRDVAWNDQDGLSQPASRGEKPREKWFQYCERRIRDHAKWPPWQTQVPRVGPDNSDSFVGVAVSKLTNSIGVEFEGDNRRTSCQQRVNERARAGSYIKNKVAGLNVGVGDQAVRPRTVKSMPPPPGPSRPGHGRPS